MTPDASSDVPHLWRDRETIGRKIGDASGVVLCLDFDGTLAPIVEDPDEAAMPAETRATLQRLAGHPAVEPAVVSGRALADLRERVGVRGVAYAGNHGMERSVDGRQFVDAAAADRQDALDRVCQEIVDRAAHVPGVTVENKGVTASVHVRRVPDDRVAAVREVVRAAVPREPDGFEVNAGKEVLEIRPPVDCDKGQAVGLIAAESPDDWLRVYVGDDVTDEDAFEALDDGLTVLVGDRGPTAADYRLPDQGDVPAFLELVERRVSDGPDR